MEDLQATAEPSAGDWIAERLYGDFGAVGRTVPREYAAYARVLHPVERGPLSELGTWARVCAQTGRIPHGLMQWAAITTLAAGVNLPVTEQGRWDEVDVRTGTLRPEALRPLLDVLAPFTGEQDCYHALWEGWGWINPHGTSLASLHARKGSRLFRRRPRPQPPTLAMAAQPHALQVAWSAPRLRLPHRDHLLFQGPLHAALHMGHQFGADSFDAQSPSLLWPADRFWCVATEIDFDSTLVGGPTELIEAVLAAPGLEAWAVSEDDDLSVTGDAINT